MRAEVYWTDKRYRRALIVRHARWHRDKVAGKPAGKPFRVVYLYWHGLQRPTTKFRRQGQFADILASCPEEVRRDWEEPRERDASWIEDGLREQFTAWNQNPQEKPWSRSFIALSRRGRALLRLLNGCKLQPEGFLRRIGGEIWIKWRRLLHFWDPDRAREQLRTAVRHWHANGRVNGTLFNSVYLYRNGFAATAKILNVHYPGGLQRFAHTIPEVSAHWSYRRSPTNPELRDELVRHFRAWRRDPIGRQCGRPFGKHYLLRKGAAALAYHIWNRGIGRILRGPEYAYIRNAWGRRPPVPRDS